MYEVCDECGLAFEQDEMEFATCGQCYKWLCERCRMILPGGDWSCFGTHSYEDEEDTFGII